MIELFYDAQPNGGFHPPESGSNGIDEAVAEYLEDNPEVINNQVYEWLNEHGATVGYSVDASGDMSITLS